MSETLATSNFSQPWSLKFTSGAAALVLLALGFIFAFFSVKPAPPAISTNLLLEKYGLRVNLVAVTAAGGMVDLRLKIVDGEKAKLLLQDTKNFPVLAVPHANLILTASEDARTQAIQFKDGGNLFLLFPNRGGAVKPGDPVQVKFGEVVVEALPAQ